MLPAVLLAACSDPPTTPPAEGKVLPEAPQARARHCYLVLTLTIDQMAELDAPGRQRGVVALRGADELLRARERVAAELDDGKLDELRRDAQRRLEEALADFDTDGDGQLATAAEVEAFNAHVQACSAHRKRS